MGKRFCLLEISEMDKGERMSIKLTHKRTSKELETALAVVKCLIGVANNQIKSEPEEERWQEELDNLLEVEFLMECSEDFYYED